MTNEKTGNVTVLLRKWSGGDRQALDALMPAVQAELRRIADGQLRGERKHHTLQPTALVNEAYLRIIDQREVAWNDRAHFFAIAASKMRLILIDHARKRLAERRGGGVEIVPLDGAREPAFERNLDVLAVHDALEALSRLDARQARIVEMRYFGGLSVKEIAHVLDVAEITVKRHWKTAKAWLQRELDR